MNAENITYQQLNRKNVDEFPKPRLRGWIHSFTAPVAFLNGLSMVILASDVGARAASAVFFVCGLLLFAGSGIYHVGPWKPQVKSILRRIDHSNVFLLIAGTYTPLAVILLDGRSEKIVLTIVWVGALLGSLFHILWITAPRWLYVPLYIALGWVAIWFLPEFWNNGSPVIVWLLIAGGIAYTVGAVFYGLRWPNPWPKWFGFHEFFHSGTVIGYACHSVAIWLAIFA
ncbi:MAG: hemolysin III family protein [Trueperella sp.]|nr:hemolysin III family protein [Trueperella sp.]